MQGSRRQVVFVSGAPGAGKTSLAVPLAAELGFGLICKDKIKETLHDALGAPQPDLAWSRKLGVAAMELLWTLAADAPAVVLEGNFRPHNRYVRERLAALAEWPVEVNCSCDPALAARRYNERALTCHPIHAVTELSPEALAVYDEPVGVGELVTVDTAIPVDVMAVAAAVRAHLGGARVRHYSSVGLSIRRCSAADLARLLAAAPDPRDARHHRERFAMQDAGQATYLLAWRGGDLAGRCTVLAASITGWVIEIGATARSSTTGTKPIPKGT